MNLTILYTAAMLSCLIRVQGSRDSDNTNIDEFGNPDNTMVGEFVSLSEEMNLQNVNVEPGIRRDYSACDIDLDSISSSDSREHLPVFYQHSASTERGENRDSPENRSMLAAWRTTHRTQKKEEHVYDPRYETTQSDTVEDISGTPWSRGIDVIEEHPSSARGILMTRSYPHGSHMSIHRANAFKPIKTAETSGGKRSLLIAPQPRRVQPVRQAQLEHEYEPQEETEQSSDTVRDISSDLYSGGIDEGPEQASSSRGKWLTWPDEQSSQWTFPTTMGFQPIDPAQPTRGGTTPPEPRGAKRPRQPSGEPDEHDTRRPR